VEDQQYALHNVRPPAVMAKACSPTSEVLRLLRRQQAGSPQWVTIVEVVQRCAKLGLSSQQVQAAIAGLVDQGFLELREGSIRVISIS
jgi:DNA-binding transcriptional regulator PaaX